MEEKKSFEDWLDEGVKSGRVVVEEFIINGITPSDMVDKLGSLEQKATPEDLLSDLMDDLSSEESEASHEGKVEDKQTRRQLLAKAIGLNTEELYKEVLYEVVNFFGLRKGSSEQQELLQYIKDAFRMDKEKHERLLEEARSRTPPKIMVNVEIVEAKDLPSSDANGLSDPFCIVYLTSDTSTSFNTSVKRATLNPVWEEKFSLQVAEKCDDYICVEVWNFNPEETLAEKILKVGKMVVGQGLCNLVEETSVSAQMGKREKQEFIGCAEVNLQEIPITGKTFRMNLENESLMQYRGEIEVKVAFSIEKDLQVAAKEHRHLLWVFAMNEIESLKAGEEWTGQLSVTADILLRQHAVQSRMTEKDVALAKYVSYAAVNTYHRISAAAINIILQILVIHITNRTLTGEEIESFWNATKNILPSCVKTIETIWTLPANDESTGITLMNTLGVLTMLESVQSSQPKDFAHSKSEWNSRSTNHRVRSSVEEAIARAALDWYNHVSKHDKQEITSEAARLRRIALILLRVRKGLELAMEFHDPLFARLLNISYAQIMYRTLDKKIVSTIKPLVEDICSKIKPLNKKQSTCKEAASLDIENRLFELYKEVKCMAKLGEALCPSQSGSLSISTYHTWFHPVVTHWVDTMLNDATQIVEKALKHDRLESAHSAPAIDTVGMYYQRIKTFWNELSWPYAEDSLAFMADIFDEVHKCFEKYSDCMMAKIQELCKQQSDSQKEFLVTKEWCLAVNNIDYMRRQIVPFAKELGLDKIIEKIAESKGQLEAAERKNALETSLNSATDSLNEKIVFVLDTIVQRMSPTLRVMLKEKKFIEIQKGSDDLIEYLDSNFATLKTELRSEHFSVILRETLLNLLGFMDEVIKMGLEKRRLPAFFTKMKSRFNSLKEFIWREEDFQDTNKQLSKMDERLTVLGMSTPELIMQFHNSRLKDQKDMHEEPLGKLIVRVRFVQDTLHIDVLSASNLIPMDNSGSSDPYVTIKFLPADMFKKLERPKTKVIHQNLFPLFNEEFKIPLTKEQRQLEDGMLLFMVKDQDLYGVTSQFLGEAYVPFRDIPESTEPVDQTHLALSVPSEASLGCDVMKALSHREDDKLAREFVKRQKLKRKHGAVPT